MRILALVSLALLAWAGISAAQAAYPLPTFTAPYYLVETFENHHDPSRFAASRWLTIGDFNADSHPDFLVLTGVSGSDPDYGMSVYSEGIGSGTGSFTVRPPIELSPIVVSAGVEAADFNRDGITDLAYATYDAVWVCLYASTGGALCRELMPGEIVKPGDFNGDGTPDLAVFQGSILKVALGRGDGTFEVLPDVALPGSVQSVVIGDVDRDGDTDLLLTNYHACDVSAFIYENDSTGHFSKKSVAVADDCLAPVQMIDLNGDGSVDLLEKSGVRLGHGDGSFGSRFAFGSTGETVAGDFDEDGIPDVVLLNGSFIQVWIGLGDGTFRSAGRFVTGAGPICMSTADMNEDGHLDLAMVAGQTGATILFGDGQGRFGGPGGFSVGRAPTALGVGDFDHDGTPDVVTVDSGSNSISVLRSRGDGSFDPRVSYATGTSPSDCAVADLDGDGLVDVAVANRGAGTVSVFLGQADGSLTPKTDFPAVPSVSSLAIGDFDEDGRPDVAVANQAQVAILKNQDGHSFVEASRRDAAVWLPIEAADVSGDGHLDVMTFPIGRLLGHGDGTFVFDCLNCDLGGSTGDPHYFCYSLADLNADCVDDVMYGVNAYTFRGGTDFMVGNGGLLSHAPLGVALEDFDGDGRRDVAAMQANGFVSVFLENRIDFGTGVAPSVIAAADFNGDGRMDLAVASSQLDAVFVHLNENSRPSPPRAPENLAAAPGEASLRLSWSKQTNTAIAGYKVYYGLAGAGSALAGTQAREGPSGIVVGPGEMSFVLHCLVDSLFAVSVSAFDGAGRERPCLSRVTAKPLLLGGRVRFEPRTWNDAAAGRWLTVSILLDEGFSGADVLLPTIRLNGVGPPTKVSGNSRADELKVRFLRSDLEPVIGEGAVELSGRVSGCRDTLTFSIHDKIEMHGDAQVDLGPPGEADGGSVSVETAPREFALRSVFPNPVSGACDFGFDLPREARVRLRVFDATGRAVADLMNRTMPAGRHPIRWQPLQTRSGVYFVKLEAGEFTAIRRFAIIRN